MVEDTIQSLRQNKKINKMKNNKKVILTVDLSYKEIKWEDCATEGSDNIWEVN